MKDKNLYSKTFPSRLLEDAWNAQITWDESKSFRLISEIRVISQHQNDLDEARLIGLKAGNIFPADEYFVAQTARLKKYS